MKKISLFFLFGLLIFLLFSSCTQKTGRTVTPADENNAVEPELSDTPYSDNKQVTQDFFFQVNDSMPVYKCIVSLFDDESQVQSIAIVDESDGTLIQTIIPSDNSHITKSALYFVDVTFDGNLELLVPVEWSARYTVFDAYEWDESVCQLILRSDFGEFWNPVIDTKNKLVYTFTSGDSMLSYSIHGFKDNQYKTTNSLWWHIWETDPDTSEPAIHLMESEGENVIKDIYIPLNENGGVMGAEMDSYYEPGSFWDLDNPKWRDVFWEWDG